ncbi:MAG: 50S ribosomal protein L11 methyltransferase [Ilumatobacteraceae bacterium]
MRAFVLTVSAADADLAADALWQLGVRAIEERLPVAAGERDADVDATGAAGTNVELWTSVGDDDDAIDRAVVMVDGRWPHRVVDVVDDRADTWREFARPMWVTDDLVVVPAWQLDDVREEAAQGTVVIAIEPAGAFGLGDHPTTMLSLRAADRLTTGPMDVVDVGCGTGVIAVMVARRQDRPVRAVDLASAAVEATRDNAERNDVGGRVIVDTTSAADLDGSYDLVVANILAPVLVEMAADLRRLTRPDGRLVISGVLADAHDHVLAALAPMEVERTDVLDGWAAVTLRHPH